jgi:uncharacterized protein YjbI with pentapeptide repeats
MGSSRWDLTSTFALSNVVTALSEAGHAPTFDTELWFCNLRRATLDGSVFAHHSKFIGVDCSGARLKGVSLATGCRFIATDFTNCKWEPTPVAHAATFLECVGAPSSTGATSG